MEMNYFVYPSFVAAMAAFSDRIPILQWKMTSSPKPGLFRLYFLLNCESLRFSAAFTSPTVQKKK